ncbi:branched-chain amino acid transport system substrate-binding protein [Paraburkholderia atlantica]|uniref:Branched-chain amino acid transport system substrate-binding protein n=1 Tax=Paraburkholderia atlantica TaxID=2654982 RepID=A0A6I1PLV3_PARAM|nr:ABC transporter substrate-binding protein [Paraburkholderia atlantica]MBB5423639.1 branched-chain amino acid transport system substrate-binding protein [Paraburkholderia atlantica]MPW05107.1 ABC transporter substrate-binding protein [Paraburkholderia atlantica]
MQNKKRTLLKAAAALVLAGSSVVAHADDVVKVGLIVPMSGPFASTGRQVDAAVKLYMAQHGDTVAGKKIQVILKDDTNVPDTTKRLAQELIVKDHVSVLAGFGLTPLALAAAPLATQAKVPMIVMNAATAMITEQSPYIVRTGFTLPQNTLGIARWAPRNGIKKVVTLVADYGPGIDAQNSFKKVFEAEGGNVVEQLRVPVANPDFSPFLQKVADLKPDALFIFVPSGAGAVFMKQFAERGLSKQGIKLIGTGDVVDDDILNAMGDVALGTVTSMHYSAALDNPENRAYVAAFEKANPSMRPNFHSVGAYDGMHLIYAALQATKGDTNGDKLLAAMKGQKWNSPRGPVELDPQTREMVQNVYITRTERVNGQLFNVSFDKVDAVKDPAKIK